MYPDTDLPPVPVRPASVERAKRNLPEHPWDRERRYAPLNLPPDIFDVLVVSPRYRLFDRLTDELGIDPVRAGWFSCGWASRSPAGECRWAKLSDDEVFDLFRACARDGSRRKDGPM